MVSGRSESQGESCASSCTLGRSAWWPLYILVDCLPASKRNVLENCGVAGILSGGGPLKAFQVDLLIDSLFLEICRFNEQQEGFRDTRGRLWIVRFKLWGALFDLEVRREKRAPRFQGSKKFLGLPRWSSQHGCHLCTTPGVRFEGRRCWPWPSGGVRLREERDFERSSPLTAGITGMSIRSASKLSEWRREWRVVTPLAVRIDELHTIGEGIGRMLLDGACHPHPSLSRTDWWSVLEQMPFSETSTRCSPQGNNRMQALCLPHILFLRTVGVGERSPQCHW